MWVSVNVWLLLVFFPSSRASCQHQRTVLTNLTGILTEEVPDDQHSTYPHYARCEWLIDAQHPNKTIILNFEYIDTECSYDFLFIYDGDSYNSPMLASLSGSNNPETILARSGKMLMYLFSDRNYERKGFKVHYEIKDCPFNCSNQGNCVDFRCYCYPGRTGEFCEREQCPLDCSHGQCVPDEENDNMTSSCKCDPGYIGYMCNISINDAEGSEYWYDVLPQGMGLKSRSAHAGAFLQDIQCLYVFGGFSLNEVLGDLKKYCFDTNRWDDVEKNNSWPEGRYEHAMVVFENGFYMFGGILESGSYSNQLWYFNASLETWEMHANDSTVQPLELSGHTLTRVEDDLYVFGGKTVDGQFWAKMYKIDGYIPSQWEEVLPLAGKSSARRLVGHSAVYHNESKSLLIYGGYSHSPDQPRYGSHTNDLHIFHIKNLIWSKINFDIDKISQNVPSQRSFHSVQIMGNYMVVYGGNAHIHHEVETCYDYKIYLYHLGCHVWVDASTLMGKYMEVIESTTNRGRVSHVSAVANGNLLLVAGGYAGYVKGDLRLFKFPQIIAPPSYEAGLDLDYCMNITWRDKCQTNPACFFCNDPKSCMHRTLEHKCKEMTSYMAMPRALCPGICPRLTTCISCLSQGQGASLTEKSLERRTYIQPCNWCVKEAKCQQRSKPQGNCISPTNTVSGTVGWWNGLSASLSQIDQCRVEDLPAGLIATKYRSGFGENNMPDEVEIIRQTTESETFRHIYVRQGYKSQIRWSGFIHPLNASVTGLISSPQMQYALQLMVEKISVKIWLSRNETKLAEKVFDLDIKDKNGRIEDEQMTRADRSLLFPNISRGLKYYIELSGLHDYPNYSESMHLGVKMYNLTLKWDGKANNGNQMPKYHPFSYEFLEPYSQGDCKKFTNCLSCMTDTKCGWCDPMDSCMQRNNSDNTCVGEGSVLMITEPSVCPVCSDHVECDSCSEDRLCEWVRDSVCCVRRGQAEESKVVRHPDQCPATCHERQNCSSCLDISECAWCENLRTCLPFYDYVSRHRHGQCTEWIDSETKSASNPFMCRNCSEHKKCDKCMLTFNCGWCGNVANPTIGVCIEGDFAGPYGNVTCSAIVNTNHGNIVKMSDHSDWSYSRCPDVNECTLGLSHCHANATCTDTPDEYICTCNRGFYGDGKSCTKTCYHKCAMGECLEDQGEYYCDCNIGWTGEDCAVDCKCNGHSGCEFGVGKCDFCLNGTTGPYCNECLEGYYGDPKTVDGCFPCQCNGHGNESLGLCNNSTGACYCTGHTQDYHCNKCMDNYYGNPGNGGKCYLQCDHGMIVNNLTAGSMGSHSGPGVSGWRAYCLWILMTEPRAHPQSITFTLEQLAVECELDHVYVYDGIPEFIDSAGLGVLLGAFCGFHSLDINVTANSGILTVYFDADISGDNSTTQGFNASYHVNRCNQICDNHSNQMCYHGDCVCKEGLAGFPGCNITVCEDGYTFNKEESSCEKVITEGSATYQITAFPPPPSTLPQGPNTLSYDPVSHTYDPWGQRGPVPRYGHVLIHCDNDIMYVFGGRSLKYGLLNDIWQYSFVTHNWTEVKPISNIQPNSRYFHTGVCIPRRKTFYIFGGLVGQHDTSKEMWKFAIDARKWSGPMEPVWVSEVAGHSMTLTSEDKLVIIGGFSTKDYFSDSVYVFDFNSYPTNWERHNTDNITQAKPTGIYGHSAVYEPQSQTIYIYGGYVYREERWRVSRSLFTYDVATNSWNLLQPEVQDLPEMEQFLKETRYFHIGAGLAGHMVILGGFSHQHEPSDVALVYNYRCNYWHRLHLDDKTGRELLSLVGAKAVVYEDAVYVFGGLGSRVQGTLYRLKLPRDICNIYNTSCRSKPGCSEAQLRVEDQNETVCFSTDGDPPPRRGRYVAKYLAARCDLDWHDTRRCGNIRNCSECIATYPQFKQAQPACTWCTKCVFGRCISRRDTCRGQMKCEIVPNTSNSSALTPVTPTCPVKLCIASTCQRCKDQGCLWSLNIPRETMSTFLPSKEWTCVLSKRMYLGYHGNRTEVLGQKDECPKPCYEYESCGECLSSIGGEGGASECFWSEGLNECMPPAYLSLHCLGGVCGTILQGPRDKCPLPCSTYTKCADCRQAQGCGWCADGSENGRGVCLQGTLSGPFNQQMCKKKNNAYPEKKTDTDVFERDPQWAYATCPPENECLNGHDNCDTDTEDCSDRLVGFLCTCKRGYKREDKDGVSVCKPVCHQECGEGDCVRPDECVCHFGYVGRNCSTKCECNGHSDCASVEEKRKCLNCTDNTQGSQCQECKPLYVGDPRDGGRCTSCHDFCHGHFDVCLYYLDTARFGQEIDRLLKKYGSAKSQAFYEEFKRYQHAGPTTRNSTKCLSCRDNTKGERCEKCEPGYFRRPNMKPDEPCIKCMCNGHGDSCDADSGLNCVCKNNTETRCSIEQGNSDPKCHEKQCADCKEYFLGKPKSGHQCYRTMTVSRDYCLDPNTQAECNRIPTALDHGGTVFFVVQPKYVNVDIRVTIDITFGGIDVFFSPREDTFVVHTDRYTGKHVVDLDPGYKTYTRRKRSEIVVTEQSYVREVEAKTLNTFITVHSPETILVIRNLRGRLVITLPNEKLNLKTSRFYMVFLSTGSSVRNETLGNIYFRQDQPHIDLFVFFSVFFSCFFLFLAMCVLVWKFKQGCDARRNRQQRAQEMLHMASRPFAKVLIHIDHPVTPFNISPSLRPRPPRKPTERTPFLASEPNIPLSQTVNTSRDKFNIVPIATEPTEDGISAVGTIVFQLPGGNSAPSHLCLGSALITQVSHMGKNRRLPVSSNC
ncbi:multiple epidermal growth factor-like domains protein 8 [Mya arenaria]|uniref:multiple epidermal growth factor-like domains protein 8 n=1 Tax=Mya arenaria TaxID=6604 RepID=UPI0022E18FAC|nr:multiple epidermal growth factor-like domains protein 8 [Mya arenaria]